MRDTTPARPRIAPRRGSIALVTLVLLTGCAGDSDGGDGPRAVEPPAAFLADVLDVRSAGEIVLDVDGEDRPVRLAGVHLAADGECLTDRAATALRRETTRTGVEFTEIGQDQSGRTLVTATRGSRDIAVELVRKGLAVANQLEADLSPEMRAAREQAMETGRGYFDSRTECTLAALNQTATDALSDALAHHRPAESAQAATLIPVLAAAIAAGTAVQSFLRKGQHDLRLLAYPAVHVAKVSARLANRVSTTRTRLQKTRVLHRDLQARERRARLAYEREQARIQRAAAAAAAAAAPAPSPPSPPSSSSGSTGDSGGSGDSLSGYTGPRCYAPGGQSWVPC